MPAFAEVPVRLAGECRLFEIDRHHLHPRAADEAVEFSLRQHVPTVIDRHGSLQITGGGYARPGRRLNGVRVALRVILCRQDGDYGGGVNHHGIAISGEALDRRIAWQRNPVKKSGPACGRHRSEEHTSELQSLRHLVCRLLLEKKKEENPTPTICSDAPGTMPPQSAPPLRCRRRITRSNRRNHDRNRRLNYPFLFFFLNDAAPPEIYPFPQHDAFPI